MSRSIKTCSIFILLSFVTLNLSGCGEGDDFQRLIAKIFPDKDEDNGTDLPTPTSISTDYKLIINAEDLINSSNTEKISIGILDDGFNTSHIELSDRLVVEQNYDDITINNDFLRGDNGDAWSWANHGTGVAGMALGKDSGIAPQAEAVTSLNRSLTDFFDAEEYFASFNKDKAGRFIDDPETNEQICVQHIFLDGAEPKERRWFPWCVNFAVYQIEKLTEVASFGMPAVTLSSTIPFGHYQRGIDLSFDQAKWDDGSYEADWARANLAEFNELYFYDYNTSYDKIQNLLATNDLVIVLAAGNNGLNMTKRQVSDWEALKRNSSNPLAQSITNVFFDPDIDGKKGITKGLLFVGALDASKKRARYSNFPGSSVEVQARFVVAPGDLRVAWPSLGEEGYLNKSGTSYAAPLVSGAIALLKANHPLKTAREIADAILATASKDIPDYSADKHGQGLLDVEAANLYLN